MRAAESIHHVMLECHSPLREGAVTFDTFVQQSSDREEATHVMRAIRHARIRGFVGPFALLADVRVASSLHPAPLD